MRVIVSIDDSTRLALITERDADIDDNSFWKSPIVEVPDELVAAHQAALRNLADAEIRIRSHLDALQDKAVQNGVVVRTYSPDYGDDKPCVCCKHPFVRHFDSYDDMSPVGCKYCGCFEFIGEKKLP